MDGVDAVGPDGAGSRYIKVGKVRGKGVAVEEENVVGVDGTDGGVETVVPGLETRVRWVAGFVERVVPGDPWVALVVGGELFPEPDGTVLEVLVVPEFGLWVS